MITDSRTVEFVGTNESSRASDSGMSAPSNPIRVALVDDKLMVREGICALLERQPGFDVVAQVATVAEAAAIDARPDVVIADLVLPDARGSEVIAHLQGRFPQAAIFVLVDDARSLPAEPAVSVAGEGGVRGYLLKTAAAAELVAGLRTVAQGLDYVDPRLGGGTDGDISLTSGSLPSGTEADLALDAVAAAAEPHVITRLTEKEREVLHYLVFGHTNAEIATLCGVSLRTVEARRARVLQKLGVRTRADLVRVARQSGGLDFQNA